MKNIICVLICFIMVLSLTACEKDKKEESLLEKLGNMETHDPF